MNTSRLWKVGNASFLALAVIGCDVTTSPVPQKLVDVLLDFCSNDTPVWFAYQVEGSPWTQLSPNTEGTYSFTANNRTVLAFVHQNGSDYHTDIVYTTSTDLEKITGQACLEEGGTKQLSGTIAGVTGSQVAFVTMNFSSVQLNPQQTSYTLTQLADRPLDLLAVRTIVSGNTQASDRVILRRSVNLVNNTTMPVLEFAGTEAVIPTTITANVSGFAAGETTLLQSNFFTQLETSQTLAAVAPASNGSESLSAVPATLLAAGDYNDLFALGIASDGSVRGVERFFRAPANQTVALGGALATPTVTTIGTSPYVRLRAQLARQAEYGSVLFVKYNQQHSNFTVTTVSITATMGHFDSGTWSIDIPNLSGVSGWENSWGLISGGGTVDWSVLARDGRPELDLGAKPNDGETVKFSSRASFTTAIRAYRASPLTVRRPRPFSRGR